ALREASPEMTVAQAQFLIEVALAQEIGRARREHWDSESERSIPWEARTHPFKEVCLAETVSSIARAISIRRNHGVRIASRLSDRGRGGSSGAGLIEQKANLNDSRSRLLSLTARGRELMAAVIGAK